jgi:NDP-sugar pyrophosphorylase family protein
MVKYLFLCGGFGTRLEKDLKTFIKYSHLVGTNKGLLKLANKPLLSYWMEMVKGDAYLVTNQLHYNQFIEWGQIPKDNIYCNSVTSADTRNGAVQDLKLAIDYFKLDLDNLIVIAGDTLLIDFDITAFVMKCVTLGKPVILNYLISDRECLKSGVIETGYKDSSGFVKVLNFLEKPGPETTASRLGSPCFYFLTPDAMSTLELFLKESRVKGKGGT